MKKRLLIFDADGTLCERCNEKSVQLLSGVLQWRSDNPDQLVAIATNQGGPACHDAGWKTSPHYPTLNSVMWYYGSLSYKMQSRLYICYLYIGKDGECYLPHSFTINDDGCNTEDRKPRPGMLIKAMYDARSSPDETLMVGDRPEDEQAAMAAGCDFEDADAFFKGYRPSRSDQRNSRADTFREWYRFSIPKEGEK